VGDVLYYDKSGGEDQIDALDEEGFVLITRCQVTFTPNTARKNSYQSNQLTTRDTRRTPPQRSGFMAQRLGFVRAGLKILRGQG
jgi:hypothetical protein